MKHFNSNRKGFIRVLLLASLIIPLIPFLLVKGGILTSSILFAITLVPPTILMGVLRCSLYSERQDPILSLRVPPWQVDINQIKEIIKGNTPWIGLKPATATKGLLIKYNAYDEIYISPEDNDFFIQALEELNDKIKISR